MPVRIDGSTGGGQVLRTALTLSALLQRPFTIENIRGARTKPGLRPQHLAAVRLVAAMCDARVQGAEADATRLTFRPRGLRPGTYEEDIGTAGSITLLLQAAFPLALLCPGRTILRLQGGTDVPFSPPWDAFRHVFLPHVEDVADRVETRLVRRGFLPRGGGEVAVEVDAPDLPPGGPAEQVGHRLGGPHLPFQEVARVVVHSVAERRALAQRQAAAALDRLGEAGLDAETVLEEADAIHAGSACTVHLEDTGGRRIGGDALGRGGLRAEQSGRAAAGQAMEDLEAGADVDRHVADQIALWVALGAAPVRVPAPTPHLMTGIATLEAFLGKGAVRLEDGLLCGRPAQA